MSKIKFDSKQTYFPKENSTDEMFYTPNLGLAAVLSLEFVVADVKVVRNHLVDQVQFGFIREEGLNEIVDRYWQEQLMVEPQGYNSKIRQLKGMVTDALKR